MNATYAIQQPGKIEVTMEMTMSLRHWKELSDQLSAAWPSSDLDRAICELVQKMNRKVSFASCDGERET